MLKKISYYRDNNNHIIKGSEQTYFKVPKENCKEVLKYGSWFPYKKGIRKINNFTVYEHRDSKNKTSGLYKVIKKVYDKNTGETKQYGGYYLKRG